MRAWSVHLALIAGLLTGFVSLQAHDTVVASAAPSLSTVSNQLLQAINTARSQRHVPALVLDKRQSACSRRHSVHMAAAGAISHDQFPDDICVHYMVAGENVGAEGGDPLTAVLDLNKSMMDEGPCPGKSCTPAQFAAHGHYMNLVDPGYSHVGIGIVVKDGTVWLTENFTG